MRRKNIEVWCLALLLSGIGMPFVQAKPAEFPVRVQLEESAAIPAAEEDFYLHVNGEWLKHTVIPPMADRLDGLSEADQQVQVRLQQITAEAVKHQKDGRANRDEQNIAALSACAQDRAGREKAGLGKLSAMLQAVEGASTPQDYAEVMAAISRKTGQAGMLGSFQVRPDPLTNQIYTVWVNPPALAFPRPVLADPANEALFVLYRSYVRDMLELYGHEPSAAEHEAAELFALQQRFAMKSIAAEQHDPGAAALYPWAEKDMGELYRSIDIEPVLRTGGLEAVPEKQNWYVGSPADIRLAAAQFTPERLPVLKSYAIIQLLHNYSSCLPAAYAQLNARYMEQLKGAAAPEPMTQQAQERCWELLGEAYGRQYAARYFPEKVGSQVLQYAEDIRAAFRNRLVKADWLGKSTRTKALAKLDAMTVKVGAPREWPAWLDTMTVLPPAQGGNFIDAALAVGQQRRTIELDLIGKTFQQGGWGDMLPQTVNAEYDPADNSITFPAGILQLPIYDPAAPAMQNLGGLGMIIAHEITHAFDSSGAHYDAQGRLRNWWTYTDWQAYLKRQQKIIQYYERYRLPDGSQADGKRSVQENIADLGALACLTDLAADDREALQQLYSSYARIWREKLTPAGFQRERLGVHLFGGIRVNAVLSATDGFYEAFPVTPADAMYVSPEDRVRLW